jgi:hypothetical protein
MDQIHMPLTGDSAVVNEVVREHAADFSVYGFDFDKVTWEGSRELGYYPVFEFANRPTGMVISIAFSSAENGRTSAFVLLIIKPGNHKLNLKTYLKLHGREDLFTFRDPQEDIRSFAQNFFEMLDRLFRSDLAPILQGEIWEDTPVDWMGYK